MKTKSIRIALLAGAMSSALLTPFETHAANDNRGKDWRQLKETVGVTWNQVAATAPRDGVTPCASGPFAGWVWATREQVTELFGSFAPAILTSPTGSVGGMEHYFSAEAFFGFIQPTFQSFLTYSTSQFASGWTASTDSIGQPYIGSVGASTTPVSISGGLGLGTVSNPDQSDGMRGVFLWRSTALGGILANPDAGQITSPNGGIAIANVLANDWVDGTGATTANAQLSLVSSASPNLSLNLATGAVVVAAGTPSGTYSLVYQISATASPSLTSQATATVTIPLYPIVAREDQGTASPSTGGVAVANVLANDTLGGLPASLARVQLSLVSTTNPGVNLDATTGRVTVAAGTPLGTHLLVYQIKELANLANGAATIVTVTVQPYAMTAMNDYARGSSKTAGVLLANVLANDTFAGARATTAVVRISQVSLTPSTTNIRLNTATGAVELLKKTSSVTYALVYEISEINDPTNRRQATVTLELSGGGGN